MKISEEINCPQIPQIWNSTIVECLGDYKFRGFPNSLRFNNSLERQNALKAIILIIIVILEKGYKLEPDRGREHWTEIRRGLNSSHPFQLSTPGEALDNAVYILLAKIDDTPCRVLPTGKIHPCSSFHIFTTVLVLGMLDWFFDHTVELTLQPWSSLEK